MDPFTIALISLVVAVLYVAFSPDPFASALRARIPWAQQKAANAVDSVDARTAAAKDAQQNTVRRGRRSLYEVKQLLAQSEIELKRAAAEIEDDNTAMALAHKSNDRDTFTELAAELNDDTAFHAQLLANHEQLVQELKALEVGVDETRAKQQAIEAQSRVMVSQARVADVTTMVNEARAGLDENGADAQMAAAQKILDKTMARASAAKSSAEGMTPNERAQKKKEAYLAQARQGGGTGVNADDLWNQLDQKAAATDGQAKG